MSSEETKNYVIDVKELLFQSEQVVVDFIRYLAEALPQIEITRKGSELLVKVPRDMSKRTLRLRIRKFLYKKGLSEDYRPISLTDKEKNGYRIKEKKLVELTYY